MVAPAPRVVTTKGTSVKTTDRHGSRATWRSIAVAAPIAAVTFLGSVAWATSVNPNTTSTAAVAPAAPAAPAQATAQATTPAAPAAPRTHKAKRRAVPKPQPVYTPAPAPQVHAVTGASGG